MWCEAWSHGRSSGWAKCSLRLITLAEVWEEEEMVEKEGGPTHRPSMKVAGSSRWWRPDELGPGATRNRNKRMPTFDNLSPSWPSPALTLQWNTIPYCRRAVDGE